MENASLEELRGQAAGSIAEPSLADAKTSCAGANLSRAHGESNCADAGPACTGGQAPCANAQTACAGGPTSRANTEKPHAGVSPNDAPICPSTSSRDADDPDITRAKRILKGLGFCGHYMHFHGGGRSGQVPMLCMLDRCGGTLSQQELGMRFELKPGSLSEILSKMEAAGLIERTRDTKDRRQLFVHLTGAGSDQARLEHEKRERFRRSAFTALTVDEQEQLAEMLEKIRVTWEELDD